MHQRQSGKEARGKLLPIDTPNEARQTFRMVKPGTLTATIASALPLAVMLLSGCVYMPETTTRYNAECGIYERRMTMQPYQVGSLMGCQDEGCVTGLVVAGVASAASAVITGSVVVVGNMVYWLERQGQCLNPRPEPDNPGPPPAK